MQKNLPYIVTEDDIQFTNIELFKKQINNLNSKMNYDVIIGRYLRRPVKQVKSDLLNTSLQQRIL